MNHLDRYPINENSETIEQKKERLLKRQAEKKACKEEHLGEIRKHINAMKEYFNTEQIERMVKELL